jgi:hypothetical protein
VTSTRSRTGPGQRRTFAGRGALAAAIAELDAALALWRGPALDALDSPVLEAAARRFDERRLALLEERIDLELDHGRHAGLVGQLVELVAEHPWRERFVAQLMRALHAAGRSHEALEQFHAARRRLADELGADTGPELTALAEAILRHDGSAAHQAAPPALAAPRTVPRELPAAVGAFTGRTTELAVLSTLLRPDADDPAMPITLIIGAGGVGKTTLAVHWGHQAASAFPDGQLYINLHGWSPGSPMTPLDALAHLLQSLGVPKDGVPDDEVDAAALYRSLLADRRCLVVLDNAHSADHVRPLLPGSPGCLVLVTSRDALAGLVAREGATVLSLGVLDTEDAEALLTRLIGSARVAAERDSCRELVRLCAGLPLALRIAAANLVSNPRLAVTRYLAAIGDVEPLTALAAQGDRDTAVRRTFDYSYRAIPAPAQSLFRSLSLHPGADFTVELAAALMGSTRVDADGLLQTLANAHMVEWLAPGRFTFHDLIRQYAAERCRRDESAQEISLRRDRLYGWHLYTAAAAAELLYPHVTRIPLPPPPADVPIAPFDDHTAAIGWLEEERANLLAVTTAAASHGPTQLAWMLADVLRGYLNRRASMVDWIAVARAGLAAAEATDARAGAASAHLSPRLRPALHGPPPGGDGPLPAGVRAGGTGGLAGRSRRRDGAARHDPGRHRSDLGRGRFVRRGSGHLPPAGPSGRGGHLPEQPGCAAPRDRSAGRGREAVSPPPRRSTTRSARPVPRPSA